MGSDGSARSGLDRAAVTLWVQKWRWYQRSRLPWNRLRLHAELARRGASARGPLHGNVLEMLRQADIAPFSIAAGAPAQVLPSVTYPIHPVPPVEWCVSG